MAKVEFLGLDTYREQLVSIGQDADKICKASLYDGANVLATAVQREIDTLTKLDPRDRKGLHDGLGIARFWTKDGTILTKIGWSGYNGWKTKRWPNGKPNAMIARAQIRGTSWIVPNKFTSRAVKKARDPAIAAIRARLDRELEARTK